MKINILIISGLMLISQPVFSGQYEDAVTAIEEGHYSQGYELLKPLAKQNNAEAQFLVGRMLIDSSFDFADEKQGVYWLQKAVDNSHMEAAQTLGKMYLSGHVVPLDTKKGAEYMALADQFRPADQPEEECD